MLKAFSAEYWKRAEKAQDCSCCAHCGRPVKKPARWMVECVDGGGTYVREDDDPVRLAAARADQASYMGWWPVGPECRKVLQADGVVVSRCPED